MTAPGPSGRPTGGRRADDGALAPYTLRDYAVLADGERGLVIGPDGGIVWMCFPGWDDPAVFASLLGGSGFYRVVPSDPFVWGGYYEERTLVWRSRWVTANAIVECREALAFPARPDVAVVLRRVVAVAGAATVEVSLVPRADYGYERVRDLRRGDDGSWTARAGGVHLRWSGGRDATVRGGDRWEARIAVADSQTHDLVLEVARRPFTDAAPKPDELWRATERAWRSAVPAMDDLPARRDARHSYAVLRGLTTPAGGMVAAATTSLPERAEAGRNYDYRYVWVRDQCFAGLAVAAAGAYPLLDDAVAFVTGRLLADGPSLMPAYRADGGRIPDQRSLGLPGYPGGADVVGNHVNEQFQLDAFGQALLLFAAAARHDRMGDDAWRAVELAVATIEARAAEADAGIWELHPKRWAHSRLECVAGLRAIGAAPWTPRRHRAEWTALADAILADVSRSCLHPSGRWQRAPDDDRVDASLLLAAIHGALPSDDPRSVTTHDAVVESLGRDGYLYRFRHDDRALGAAEGAFLLCGFWASMACLERGDAVGATRWFERNRAACGSPGLYSEEFDVGERQLRGNLPQAFVHAGMLECAARLSAR
jgi:alpha,alpha-trehalase